MPPMDPASTSYTPMHPSPQHVTPMDPPSMSYTPMGTSLQPQSSMPYQPMGPATSMSFTPIRPRTTGFNLFEGVQGPTSRTWNTTGTISLALHG
ncbi:hypothetical protein U9M48_019801 [Paspalum notatum var. saurae]|uniref:Uncharacterized protein n=1 Tax=Paspalum notatum var. saurae TaxID=547442 RepID=A0AAQ3WRK0_PASNO